jgi:hypothetical protein
MREIETELTTMSSSPQELPRHFAAMALAKAVRLCRGMLTLQQNGLEDVVDATLRLVAEHATLGMYLLYGGDDAFEEVRGAHVHGLALIDRATGSTNPLVAAWTGPRRRLHWENLMHNTVPDLIVGATGDQTARHAFVQLYNETYRGQSLLAAHAGIGTIARHLTTAADGTRTVDPEGYLIEDGTGTIIMAGSLIGLLATHVLMAFGRDPTRVVELSAVLSTKTPDDIIVDREEPPGRTTA